MLNLRQWSRTLAKFPSADQVQALQEFLVVSLRQCNSYAALRLKRSVTLLRLYQHLYNESSLRALLKKAAGRWLAQRRYLPFGGSFLMGAAGFSFKSSQGITDEEMAQAGHMFDFELKPTGEGGRGGEQVPTKLSGFGAVVQAAPEEPWQLLVDRADFKLWKRPVAGQSYLSEYKAFGRYFDLPATAFFATQLDLAYRRVWDNLVISLDIVDTDDSTGSEVVRWVTHFPYPMYPREYVYVRRACVDRCHKYMVLLAHAVDHPACPEDSKAHVRVHDYYSHMVIRPHTDFVDNGFDYVLTYFDDPKSPFPSPAYAWMARKGVPSFVDKVYHAAKQMHGEQAEKLKQNTPLLSPIAHVSQKHGIVV